MTGSPLWGIEAFNNDQSGGPIGSGAQAAAEFIVDDTTPISVNAGSASFNYDSSTGAQASNPKSVGRFQNGITAPGTELPDDNQNATDDAQYEGGVGIDQGVVLCTGWLTDSQLPAGVNPGTGRGVGVQGPNNGSKIDTQSSAHPGEISYDAGEDADEDFEDEVFPMSSSSGGDAAALQFTITVDQPGYLEVTTVFASDEHPAWDDSSQAFNDSFCVFIGNLNIAQNIKLGEQQPTPFTLYDLKDCGTLFFQNQIAPSPPALVGSDHTIQGGAPYYDHEFGGFTIPITWSKRLGPGTYDIKIVIQDVKDFDIDSALFIPKDGIRLNTAVIVPGDCNLDGVVDEDDEDLVDLHWGQDVDPWTDGDCTGDGHVDAADKGEVLLHWDEYEWRADIDRDGDVDGDDLLDMLLHAGLQQCALKEHGDADGDGDVDGGDEDIWEEESGGGT